MELQIYFSLYGQHCNLTEVLDNSDLKNQHIKNLSSSLNQYVVLQYTFKVYYILTVVFIIKAIRVQLIFRSEKYNYDYICRMLHQFQHQEMELQIHFPLYGLMVLIKISVHMIGA